MNPCQAIGCTALIGKLDRSICERCTIYPDLKAAMEEQAEVDAYANASHDRKVAGSSINNK